MTPVDRTHLLVDSINIHVNKDGLPVHRQYFYVNRTTLPVNRMTPSVHWRQIFFPQTLLYAQKKILPSASKAALSRGSRVCAAPTFTPPTP